MKLVVSVGVNAIVITLLPAATPVTVSVVALPELLTPVNEVDVGLTVALAGVALLAVNVPATLTEEDPDLTVAVNVAVLPVHTVPLLALNVIVGVTFPIESLFILHFIYI